MFKYVKFTKVKDEFTTHEFRGGDESVKVNYFTGIDVVSIEADVEADIDALINKQSPEINCAVITQAKFRTLVQDSAQLNRIREVIAEEIGKKYTLPEEIGLQKRASDDAKRVNYEAYVSNCILIGDKLKSKIGY